MTNIERIDREIKELQRIRRIVVKGEKKFNKDEKEDILKFIEDLENHDIPYQAFTYGNSVFYKIEEREPVESTTSELVNENTEVIEHLENN